MWKKRDFFVMAIFLDIDSLFLKFRNCEHSVPRTSLGIKWTFTEQTLCGVWKLYTYKIISKQVHSFSSVQFSRWVVSDSFRPHESQHARPPCPSPTPRVHSDSSLSSWWCHSAISSSVVPFSSCPQSLPASESFPFLQRCIN